MRGEEGDGRKKERLGYKEVDFVRGRKSGGGKGGGNRR